MAIVTDQENNSTLGQRRVVVSRSGPIIKQPLVAASASGCSSEAADQVEEGVNNANNIRIDADHCSRQYNYEANMEYAWLEPRHDPIATDTNLAEIDFENFKNEDLAYAFSCGVSLILFFL